MNLMQDLSSLGKFEIIFCRNVAIYFTNPDKISLFRRIERALEPDGYLVVGAMESLTGFCPQFESKRHLRSVYYQVKTRWPGVSSFMSSNGQNSAPTSSSPGPKRPHAAREVRARLRLLLVEDNKVNQAVALGILENLGYEADVAVDGRSALIALGRRDYDLVLMDCQMPEMDGYEATRLIRQRDTAVRNHDIPIIAVTAHAMAGDRELCLASGMNDYVSKPLRADLLEQVIEKWMPVSTAATEVVTAPAGVTAAASSKAFDHRDFIDRLMGNRQLARRILRGFVEDMPRQIARLAQAVSEGDAGQGAVGRAFHQRGSLECVRAGGARGRQESGANGQVGRPDRSGCGAGGTIGKL